MKKFLITGFSVFILLVLLCSCFESSMLSSSFFAMDTYITVQARTSDRTVFSKIRSLVSSDEKKLSRTLQDSEIYLANKNGGGTLSKESAYLVKRAFEFSDGTYGCFNPLMGGLTDLWDIKSENPKVPSEEEIQAELLKCRVSNVTLAGNDIVIKEGAKLDLGGIAKGYSAQRVIDVLRESGVKDALVGFGGSIACIGNPEDGKAWNIGIKNPFDTSRILGTVKVTDCYIAVSGSYERFFEKDGIIYHHILDPITGYPARSDLESTVVISSDGICADALSTALFVMGFDKALELYNEGRYDFEAILVKSDGTVYVTAGLRDDFLLNPDAIYNKEEKLRISE